MTKILAVLLATQLTLVQGWAPIQTLPYAELPKTLEFAEKVWFLPQPEGLTGPRSLPEDQQYRSLPWTHQRRQGNDDSYFFDGYSGAVDQWPSRQAFLQSQKTRTALQMKPKKEETMEADFYYDDMGNLVSWQAPKQAERHYFEGIGASHFWSTKKTPTALQMTSKNEEALETADHYYYDDMGNLVSWDVPRKAESYFFDGIGQSHYWPSSAAESPLRQKPKEVLGGFGMENCEHPYYSDTGDLMCWVGQ